MDVSFQARLRWRLGGGSGARRRARDGSVRRATCNAVLLRLSSSGWDIDRGDYVQIAVVHQLLRGVKGSVAGRAPMDMRELVLAKQV